MTDQNNLQLSTKFIRQPKKNMVMSILARLLFD